MYSKKIWTLNFGQKKYKTVTYVICRFVELLLSFIDWVWPLMEFMLLHYTECSRRLQWYCHGIWSNWYWKDLHTWTTWRRRYCCSWDNGACNGGHFIRDSTGDWFYFCLLYTGLFGFQEKEKLKFPDTVSCYSCLKLLDMIFLLEYDEIFRPNVVALHGDNTGSSWSSKW